MEIEDTIQGIMKDYPTQKIGLDDFYGRQTVINMLNKAINYNRCCEELPIYMTYDNSDSEVFAAFTDKERCELESEECGVPMQKTTLYFGKRK